MTTNKFRVWDVLSNDWIKTNCGQFLLGLDGKLYFLQDGESQLEQVKDCIVQQFIGLTDKNDKEIYEGDIVRWRKGASPSLVLFGKLGYDSSQNGLTGFALSEWLVNYGHEDFYELDYHFDYEDIEVIGNFLENPELLKGDPK